MTITPNDDIRNSISDRRRTLEIIAVVLTGAGKIVFMDILHQRFAFIILAIILWIAYVIYRKSRTEEILSYWGFRTDNFNEVTRRILPFGIVAVITFFVIGYYRETIHLSWHIFPILILYPVWGVIQQFLVIALVAGNLQDLRKKNKFSAFVIIVLTALLFGLVHYPYYWLMLGTFILALLYGYIYLKSRNVYVMGLFHGWLGGLFFYTVVGRDPFNEVFGRLF